MIVEWWLARHQEFRHFLWTGCLTLALSAWSGIQTDPGNFIMMMPAVILFFAILAERWPAISNVITASVIGGLLVLIWVIFIATLEKSYQPIQNPVLFFPLPLILLIILYWIRGWAILPPKLYFDTFLKDETLSRL